MEERRRARRHARAQERRTKRAENGENQRNEKLLLGHSEHIKIFDDDDATDALNNNQTAYPEWSWDHVRPWVILRRDTAYDDDQIRQIAGHDIFVLEKMTGWKSYGSNEAGSLEAARRVKKLNPRIKTLFYLNAMIHYPGYSANDSYIQNEWATKNQQNEIYLFKNRYLWYNHSNLDFREWWINRALDMVAHDEIDGIFIDAIMKTSISHLGCPDNAEAYFQTALELRRRLPEGKLLIGNALRPKARGKVGGYGNIRHLQYLDGSYFEGWMRDADSIEEAMELMSATLKSGRMVLLNGGPVFKSDEEKTVLANMIPINDRYSFMKDRIAFPLAIFLLVVEPFAYFSYHYGVDANPGGRVGRAAFDCNRFEEITRRLGEPTGSYAMDEEFTFTRKFQHLSVWVNVKTGDAKLIPQEMYHEEL
eukprot:CCRYP_011359-RA/>CCRYP_011359-RA protein AED:0.00 eAED:0.00 QI:216/-1/1/1/-1/1/1/106/420